jgi:hypothetical protein
VKLRLALLSCALTLAPHAHAFQFGVCTHLALARSNAAEVLESMQSAGFDGLRDDMYWGAVESERGAPRIPAKYAEMRAAFAAAAKAGKSSIVVLGSGNRHYDANGLPRSDEASDAYAKYAGFVARELKPDVRQFEIWNEWNTGFGSKPRVHKGDAADYAKLLEKASAAIHRENPAAIVIGGATSGVDFKWFDALAAAGGLKSLDAVSVHSYTLFRLHPNPEGAVLSLDKLRKLLRQAEPTREIPIYVSEVGWPTNVGKRGVSERGAAMYLARFALLARTRPWIAGVYWYDLQDDGDDDSSSEQRFGLVRRNREPKPALSAARVIAPLLRSAVPPTAYRAGGNYFVAGTDATGRWAVGWTIRPDFLSWDAGTTLEPDAPAELAALAAQLPADGFPVLFRLVDGGWRAFADWMGPGVPRVAPAPPANKGAA